MQQLYLETIRVLNGRVYNIKYHNERCLNTRRVVYDDHEYWNLRQHINIPNKFKNGLVKCRITYGHKVEKVEFEKYSAKEITSLQLVCGQGIDYDLKSAERSRLKNCYDQKRDADDIIIIKNGLLTDTYYANIALLKNGTWYTPKTPLLKGTMRAKLLNEGKLVKKNITADSMKNYEQITIFNALIPFKSIVLPITAVRL